MDLDISNALKLVEDNKSQFPLLRIYGWKPWAISLGKNQIDTSINYQECSIRGIDIVRRPTGGRAVLHANELTYFVTVPC
jgi:lipoate-protein ligase A